MSRIGKALKCELCGGNEFEKIDNLYVCQHCKTKYTVEEARALIGTVKIDNTDKLSNLYKIARQAKKDGNDEHAAKYYDMIHQEDPNSWEAAFYVVYYSAMQTNIANIQSAAFKVNNCLDSVLKLVKDNVNDSAEQMNVINEIYQKVLLISEIMYNAANNNYNNISTDVRYNFTQDHVHRLSAIADLMYGLGTSLEENFGYEKRVYKIISDAWKNGIAKHIGYISLLKDKETNKNIILSYVEKVKKYDPQYTTPSINTSACYIATAVYGSYDCPQVLSLRSFRDNVLLKTWHGRLFVKIYYRISPSLVKWFGRYRFFILFFRRVLDGLVHKIAS